jgi:single-strand DNA-binding protein
MASYNHIVVVGNLTRDPEVKAVNGSQLCKCSIAINNTYKNRQTGAMVNDVCYVDVTVWGAQVESCRLYLQKGKQVLVEGRLKLDTWKDQEGQTRSKHSITAEKVVFLGSREEASGLQENNDPLVKEDIFPSQAAQKKRPRKESKSDFKDITLQDETPFIEDDLPF